MEIIESIQNNHIKEICKLHEKKYRNNANLFIIEGPHLVEEAFKNNLLVEIIALPEENISIPVKVTYVTKKVMSKISDLPSIKGVIGIAKKFNPLTYGKRLLILDNIQDPGNLGTIIRSSVAFNIDTIILGDNCVDLYNDKVVRSTEGMLFNQNIMTYNLLSFLPVIQNDNYEIYGTNVLNGNPLNKIAFPDKFAIIIGNEGQGINPELNQYIHQNIYIPMNKKCESLNASVAASIIMYEMSKSDYE